MFYINDISMVFCHYLHGLAHAQVCCKSWETTPCRSICWPTQCMTSLFIFFQRETRALTTSQAESGYV